MQPSSASRSKSAYADLGIPRDWRNRITGDCALMRLRIFDCSRRRYVQPSVVQGESRLINQEASGSARYSVFDLRPQATTTGQLVDRRLECVNLLRRRFRTDVSTPHQLRVAQANRANKEIDAFIRHSALSRLGLVHHEPMQAARMQCQTGFPKRGSAPGTTIRLTPSPTRHATMRNN